MSESMATAGSIPAQQMASGAAARPAAAQAARSAASAGAGIPLVQAPNAAPSGGKRKQPVSKALIGGGVVVALLAAAAAAYVMGVIPGVGQKSDSAASAPAAGATAANAGSADNGTRAVATVDGRTVYERDIAPLVNQGVDRAVAIDRLINRMVLAGAAGKEYADEAKSAAESLKAEVEANVWLQRKTDELRKAVTDKEVADWYAREVRDELYRQAKLRFYLTQNADDAKSVAQALKNDDRSVLAKFEPFAKADKPADKAGDKAADKNADKAGENQFVPLAALPYGLGRTLADAKPGYKSEPILVRNGWFVFYVEDIKQQEKPKLDDVKERIVGAIVAEKLNKLVGDKRKDARIELKG